MSEETQKKALSWIAGGETGMSSKAMWAYFMGVNGNTAHPHDPDDFSRCYKLLELVPEWKPRILELGRLSPIWYRLVLNWDKLTEMFEENERTNWENYKAIGMYEFMQDLIYNN